MAADAAEKVGLNRPKGTGLGALQGGSSSDFERDHESEDYGKDLGSVPAFMIPSRPSLKFSLRTIGPLSITTASLSERSL
jgi:hypothetical protein